MKWLCKSFVFRSMVFLSILMMVDQTFATQDKRSVQVTPGQMKIALGPLLAQTNKEILSDINSTQTKIQKMADIKVQGDAIRALLLRLVGRISSYTIPILNMYLPMSDGQIIVFPYVLIGAEANIDSTWMDFMKDPAKAPQFKDPLVLIETIKKNFQEIADAASSDGKEASKEIDKAVAEEFKPVVSKLIKPKFQFHLRGLGAEG